MNVNHLTINELLNYLELTNTDPAVRRLVDLILTRDMTLAGQLIEQGMDPCTQMFYNDGAVSYEPGEYIRALKSNIDYLEDELWVTKNDLEDMTDECNSLKTRTIMDFVLEVQKERIVNKEETYKAKTEVTRLKEENKELLDKINVWKILEQ